MTNNKKSTRYYSGRQEKRVAKKLGGKMQANSGAAMFAAGDVLCSKFLIECKTATKEKASMSIKADWIDKLKEEAFAMNKEHWALAFNFGGLYTTENFYIIDENLFRKLAELLDEEE